MVLALPRSRCAVPISESGLGRPARCAILPVERRVGGGKKGIEERVSLNFEKKTLFAWETLLGANPGKGWAQVFSSCNLLPRPQQDKRATLSLFSCGFSATKTHPMNNRGKQKRTQRKPANEKNLFFSFLLLSTTSTRSPLRRPSPPAWRRA